MATTNRLRSRLVTVPAGGGVVFGRAVNGVVQGQGLEGVLNGGDQISILVCNTVTGGGGGGGGGGGALTAIIYRRPNRSGSWSPDATTHTLQPNTPKTIDLEAVASEEVAVFIAPTGQTETVEVSATTRGR
ncbi:MAG: hypothetical protein JNK72_24570 [Myxococcales bacterium]|nr:hypothetical protein [Myxococcales bacterium]